MPPSTTRGEGKKVTLAVARPRQWPAPASLRSTASAGWRGKRKQPVADNCRRSERRRKGGGGGVGGVSFWAFLGGGGMVQQQAEKQPDPDSGLDKATLGQANRSETAVRGTTTSMSRAAAKHRPDARTLPRA